MNLPDDIKFLNQLYKLDVIKIDTLTLKSEIETKISEAENTPLYSALSEWSIVVPENASPIFTLSWYLGLLMTLEDWDVLKREVLIKILKRGIRFYEPGNCNEIFLKFIEYFQEGDNSRIKRRSPFNFAEVLEFLILSYGRDTVFGNLVPATAKFLKKPETYYRIKKKKAPRVRRPQRKRGYNDKGSLPEDFRIDPPFKEEREIQIYKRQLAKEIEDFNFYPEDHLWFNPTKPSGGAG